MILPSRRSLTGFTLIELLVVVAILLALAALVFTVSSRAVQAARITHNMSKLRDLGGYYGTYAAEYGHYPPGWDPSYGKGPLDRDGNPMNGRGPDLINAFREVWEMHDGFLSPTAEGRLVGYNGTNQPTNYSAHPVLGYHPPEVNDPVPAQNVSRPSETFLLLDGVPKDPSHVNDPGSSKNCQTGVRQWNRFTKVADPRRAQAPLPTTASEGRDRNGPDFRNNGKCHVLFCDGSVRAFRPEDFKVKHVTLGY